MASPSRLSAAVLYGALLVAFHLAGRLLPEPGPPMVGMPAPASSSVPELRWRRTADGVPRAGVDGEALRRSLQRLPVVVLLRRVGNSLRLALGQTPEWYFRGRVAGSPETLFLAREMVLAEGLTPTGQETVRRAVATITDLQRHLSAEGWQVLILPVPTKLNLYRERIAWPLDELDPFTRRPLDRDRSDEVCDALFRELRAAQVPALDLRAEFRRAIMDGVEVNPPGESHWSAAGLSVAAESTAHALASLGLETTDASASARLIPYRLSADMAERSEALDGFPRWLANLRYHDETVTWGTKSPGRQTALVAVSGTSYTGQYTWMGEAGLAAELDRRLPSALVRSFAEAGRGSLQTAHNFLSGREALLREVDPAKSAPGRCYWIWEFPLRDLASFDRPIAWVPLRGKRIPFVRFDEGFHPEEKNNNARFRWARRNAEMVVTVFVPGTYRIRFGCITPYSLVEGRVTVSQRDRQLGVAIARGTDFAHPVATEFELALPVGETNLRLESDHDEVTFGPTDPRAVAYGLILPVELIRVGP